MQPPQLAESPPGNMLRLLFRCCDSWHVFHTYALLPRLGLHPPAPTTVLHPRVTNQLSISRPPPDMPCPHARLTSHAEQAKARAAANHKAAQASGERKSRSGA